MGIAEDTSLSLGHDELHKVFITHCIVKTLKGEGNTITLQERCPEGKTPQWAAGHHCRHLSRHPPAHPMSRLVLFCKKTTKTCLLAN